MSQVYESNKSQQLSRGGGQKGAPSLKRQGSSESMRSVDTPTRLRNMYGVNSPKAKTKDKHAAFNNATVDGNEPNYPAHLITQVDRPGTNNTNNTQNNRHQENLQQAGYNRGCCWLCLNFCGFRQKDRNAPRTELAVANKSGSRTNNDAVARPHQHQRNTDEDEITQTDSSGHERKPDGMTAEPERPDDGYNHPWAGGHSNPDGGVSTNYEPEESDSLSRAPLQGLLTRKTRKNKGKKCLVLDLDETLVHSSFKPVANADFIVPVEIDGVVYKVYVLKRPFVDDFLIECAKYYEIVIFTASLSKYANPLLDMLDTSQVIEHRLFRESCVLHGQAYVKDLSKLGRRMEDVIFVDNSPLSYAFQPTSAVPILSWFDDPNDTQLRDLMPVLRTTLRNIDDVRTILDANNKSFEWLCKQDTKPIKR